MLKRIERLCALYLPKKIMYLCFMNIFVHSTSGKYSNTDVSKITAMEVIERWSKDKNV